MIKKLKEIVNNFLGSLDNKQNSGFSGRKLTGLFAVLIGACVTYVLPPSDRLHALYAWQILALLCLGIVTVEQIIKFKTGQSNDKGTV
jgi:hypothetical protein